MAYTPTVWKDGQAPALNAENLNHMEDGIVGAEAAANQALEMAQKAGMKTVVVYNAVTQVFPSQITTFSNVPDDVKFFVITLSGGSCIVDANQLGNTFMLEFAESISNGTRTKGIICGVTKTGIAYFNCRQIEVVGSSVTYSTPPQFPSVTLTVTAIH